MNKFAQAGFDFGDETPAFRAAPYGTWNTKSYTFQGYTERFALAQSNLASLTGLEHAVFEDALQSAIEEHAKQVAWCNYSESDTEYSLWGSKIDHQASDIESIIAHCRKSMGRTNSRAEYKVTEDVRGMICAGMYVPGVGSVVVSKWTRNDGGHSMSYTLDRDTHFLECYLDSAERVYCNQLVWEPAYAAQAICESGDKIASVKTFTMDGRRYVHKGATWGRDMAECTAYSICLASEWKGDTFTYKTLTKAWDDGTMGRGDSRGLLVRVQGTLCVLEKYVYVYDDQPRTAPIYSGAEEEDEEPLFDEHDEQEEHDDEEALEFA